MAVTPATGRNPAEREQILASQNLLPTEYMAPNNLVYGNAPGFGDNGTVGLYPGKQYTLYDNRTNSVLASGSTPEEIKGILSIINTDLVPQGNKADWRLLDMGGTPAGRTLDMHTTLPSGFGEAIKVGDQYGIPIAGDVPNSFFNEYILPTLAIAAATGGAYFGGNALLGATGGGGAGGAGAVGAGAGAGGASSGLIPGALNGLSFAPVAAAPVAASSVAPIIVTAGTGALTAAEAAALATAAAGTAGATTGGTTGASTSTVTNPAAATTAAASGSELAPLTVTAGSTPTNLLPASLATGSAATAATAANATGSTTNAADLANSRTGMTDAELAATNAGAGGTSFLDKIISNMGITDYATLASLAASAVSGGGGSGGAGSTTPYVSPFGAGTDFAGLASRRQINPNIADYEKYGFGPEAQFFSGAQGVGAGTPGAATTTPNAGVNTGGPLALPTGTTAGVVPPATPVTTTTTAPATTYQTNLKNPDIWSYMKTVNDSLGSFYKMGQMTDQQVRDYQQKMYDAINTPGMTADTFRNTIAMPQYTMFNQPTGTPVANVPAPFEYTAPAQPASSLSGYMNDLYSQIGSKVSQGLLSVADAQKIQRDLTNVYRTGGATTQGLQSAFDTASQQYKPLI